jgi:hypothetical protein
MAPRTCRSSVSAVIGHHDVDLRLVGADQARLRRRDDLERHESGRSRRSSLSERRSTSRRSGIRGRRGCLRLKVKS